MVFEFEKMRKLMLLGIDENSVYMGKVLIFLFCIRCVDY